MPILRKHRRGLVLLLVSLCPSLQSFQAQQSSSTPAGPLPANENLHYSIEWRLITAGKAHLAWTASAGRGFQTNLQIESAGLAAERATKAGVRAIGAALEAIERAMVGDRSAVDEDLGFRRAIAQATGNPEFARFLQFIGRHLIPRRTVSGLPERMGGQRAYLALIQEEHRRIYDAIAAGDPKAARDAMRRHLTRSLERYRKLAAEQKKAA